MYKDEDFDILVKSTLDNGAEKVPAGLWDRIEQRLDAAEPAPVVRRPIWKRLAAGVAFACVAVCCALLLVPHKAGNVEAVAELVELASDDEIPAVANVDEAPTVVYNNELQAFAGGNEIPAVAIDDEIPAVANNDEAPAVANADEIPAVANDDEVPAVATETVETHTHDYNIFDEPRTRANGIRYALTGNLMSGGHAGSRASYANRMSSSQMDFAEDERIYESANTFYLIPIIAGVGLRINFTKRWSLGVGLNYTYLKRRFEGSYDYGGTENYICKDITNDQHYVGIPVNAFYNITTGGKIKFYVYAGGTVEKCVSNSYSFKYYDYNKVLKQSVGGLQASVNAGLGLQFCITDHFGIYLDPSFRYYFRNYLQPKSLRTTQPFQINAELGVRWDL